MSFGAIRSRHLRRAIAFIVTFHVAFGFVSPAGATHLPPPTSVSLTATKTVITTEETSTLTATANGNVYHTGHSIKIVNLTGGTGGNTCATGSTCGYGPFYLTAQPPQSYQAQIVSSTGVVTASSQIITVSRAPWTITLTTDRTTVKAGEYATLTAKANQKVGFSSTYYKIAVFDQTLNRYVIGCTTGNTCSGTVRIDSGPPHTYVAYIDRTSAATPTAEVQAISAPVTISRAPWTVTLEADRTNIVPGQAVTFTATANQNVGYTATYSIVIYDLKTRLSIGACSNGTTCTRAYAPTAPDQWFVAYVAKPNGTFPPPEVQARSNVLNVQLDPAQTRGCGNLSGTANPTVSRADPVNTATGALCETFTDLQLPGRGVTFALTRTYNSNDPATGPFGPGWSHSYGAALLGTGTTSVTFRAEDGQEVRYTRQPDGSYQGTPGAASTLVEVSGGYHLTTPERLVYEFDATGGLVGLVDRQGRGLSIGREAERLISVTDEAGRTAAFSYAGDRLASVTLPDGRHVEYGYTDSRLTTYRDPTGSTTSYGYDAAGRLTTVTDPLGHVVSRNVYDPASGRVIEQYDALNNKTTFAWNPATGTATTTDPRGAVVTDVYAGNVLIRTTDPAGTYKFGYDEQLRRTHVTDPLGRLNTMSYDATGNMVSRRAPEPLSYEERYTYDAEGNVLTAADGRGITVVTNTYDALGRTATVTDALGGTTSFTYSSGGDVASVTDQRGKTTAYEHDSAGNLVAVVTPLGGRTTMDYDSSGRLIARVDPRGNVAGATEETRAAYRTTFAYDDADRLIRVTDPRGNITRYTYDAASRLQSRTDPLGHVWVNVRDDAGRLMNLIEPPNPILSAVTSYEYDAVGNLVSVTTPLGHRTSYVYDLAGRRTSVVDPRGNEPGATPADFTTNYEYDAVGNLVRVTAPPSTGMVTTYDYDVLNRPTRVTDALGHATTTTYDAADNPLAVTNPLGKTQIMAYDALGRLLTDTDERGKTSTFTYDATGNLTARTTPLGATTTYGYDDEGRLTSVVDPRGNVALAIPADYRSILSYDEAGNRIASIDPLGNERRWTYDAANNVTEAVDPNGHSTGYTYDALDRLVGIRGPDVRPEEVTPTTGMTRYAYDVAGNLVRRTSPLGHTTTLTFDAEHQPTVVTDPLERSRTSAYDAAGNRVRLVTARGTAAADPSAGTILLDYDALDRPTAIDYGDSTPDVTYTYDAAGRRSTMGDGVGHGSDAAIYTYDAADRLTGVSRSGRSFTYGYDDAGNVVSRTYPDASVINYDYDDDGRLATVTYAGQTTTYDYDAAGNLLTTALPVANGHEESRTVDRAGRLVGIRTAKGASVLSAFDRVLDPAGNPTKITVTRDATTTVNAYEYDPADRLTKICPGTESCTGVVDYTTYAYDLNSNRTTSDQHGGSTPDTTYAYDAADQLITETSGTTVRHSNYDPDGNLIRRTTESGAEITYSYDLSNRLTGTIVTDDPPGSTRTSTYSFDGDGNRVTYAVDGTAVEQIEWDATTSPPTPALRRVPSGSLRQRVVAGLGALALTVPSGTSYLHHDLLGSTSDVSSASGVPQLRYDYSPFGDITETTLDPSAPENDLTFTGQILDRDTGDYHLHARQYQPGSSRFLSVDPLAAPHADPHVSSYVYAANSPLRFTDPHGLSPLEDFDFFGALKEGGRLAQAGLDATLSAANRATSAVSQAVVSLLPERAQAAIVNIASYKTVQMGAGVGDFISEAATGIVRTALNPVGAAEDMVATCKDAYGRSQGFWSGLGNCLNAFNPFTAAADQLVEGVLAYQRGCYRDAAKHFAGGVAGTAALAAGGVGAVRRFSGGPPAAPRAIPSGRPTAPTPDVAFHYTSTEAAESIARTGLRPGGFATPNGGMSPLQAQIDLALPPNRGLPGGLVQIDVAGLRRAGFEIPEVTQVGRSYGMPGGGWEMRFPFEVPSEFLKSVPNRFGP